MNVTLIWLDRIRLYGCCMSIYVFFHIVSCSNQLMCLSSLSSDWWWSSWSCDPYRYAQNTVLSILLYCISSEMVLMEFYDKQMTN